MPDRERIADTVLPTRTPKRKRKAILLATCPHHGFDLLHNGWYSDEQCEECEVAWGWRGAAELDADLWLRCLAAQQEETHAS